MPNDIMFFDSHCHFDFPEFDADRTDVWLAAQSVGVKAMVMPGVYPQQWERLMDISLAVPGFNWAFGIHPCWIHQVPVDADSLRRYETQIETYLAALPERERHRCVAIGECGLDKTIDLPLSTQLDIFNWHVDLANRLHKPLIVHSLKTHNELISLCKKNKPRYGGVVHAFSGSYETAMQLINLGFYLGAGGVITYERAQKTRATFARVPLEMIVLETDAPDMPPSGRQGMRNTSQAIPLIAQALADLRGISVNEVAHATWNNTNRLFYGDQAGRALS